MDSKQELIVTSAVLQFTGIVSMVKKTVIQFFSFIQCNVEKNCPTIFMICISILKIILMVTAFVLLYRKTTPFLLLYKTMKRTIDTINNIIAKKDSNQDGKN